MASMSAPVERLLLERNPSIIFPFVPSPPLSPVLVAVLEVVGMIVYDLRRWLTGTSALSD